MMIEPSTAKTSSTSSTDLAKRIHRSRLASASRSSCGMGGTSCGFTIPSTTM